MTCLVILPPFLLFYATSLLLNSIQYFVFHTICLSVCLSDVSHPSPAPHFRTFPVFLIYFPKCPSFSTIQNDALSVAIYECFPWISIQFSDGNSILLECYFCHWNLEFIFTWHIRRWTKEIIIKYIIVFALNIVLFLRIFFDSVKNTHYLWRKI